MPTVTGTFNDRGLIEPSAAPIILCTGRKGSGKTVMCLTLTRVFWDAPFGMFPYDIVVIDVAGDDGPMPSSDKAATHDVITISGTVEDLPRSWATLEMQRKDRRPMIVRYVPDPASVTELEDMDAVVGLAYAHSGNPNPCLLIVHEVGRVAPAGRTPGHMKKVLNHSRHHKMPVILCGPRPQTIDPLVVQQADLVYTFELKSVRDRRRIAEDTGQDPKEFDADVLALGVHEYLRYDARAPQPEQDGDQDLRLVHFPPLPLELVDQVKAWAAGDPPKPE